jgi:hypothetical protein
MRLRSLILSLGVSVTAFAQGVPGNGGVEASSDVIWMGLPGSVDSSESPDSQSAAPQATDDPPGTGGSAEAGAANTGQLTDPQGEGIAPLNAEPAQPLIQTPSPLNAQPNEGTLTPGTTDVSGSGSTSIASPSAPSTPAPLNAGPADPLIQTPAPSNATPATPLIPSQGSMPANPSDSSNSTSTGPGNPMPGTGGAGTSMPPSSGSVVPPPPTGGAPSSGAVVTPPTGVAPSGDGMTAPSSTGTTMAPAGTSSF